MSRIARLCLTILLACFFSPLTAFAADTPVTIEKKNVALIIVNPGTRISNVAPKQIPTLWIDPICKSLNSRYNVSADPKYYEKLKSAGFSSVIGMEKSELMDVLKNDNLDYVILIEFLPRETFSFGLYGSVTTHSHLKIVALNENKTLYNGKFSSKDKVKPMADGMITVINEKLMQN